MTTDIEDLIRKAFWAARDKGKSDWWRMTTPVLKNRLLTLTDRQFNEEDYGARTVVEFALRCRSLLLVDTTTYPPEVELKATRIRADLWRAITDYTSGATYVWDRKRGVARTIQASEGTEFVIPTIGRNDLAAWRADFAERHRELVPPREGALLADWVKYGLRIADLPEELRGLWNREQSWRTWERLHSWFERKLPESERPQIAESQDRLDREEQRSATDFRSTSLEHDRDADAEQMARCRDGGDWLGVGELLCNQLATATPEVREILFSQIFVAWANTVRPFSVNDVADAIDHLQEMAPEQAARALVHTCYRVQQLEKEIPPGAGDLAFRLADQIESIFKLTRQRVPMQLCLVGAAKVAAGYDQLVAAVEGFRRTNTATAKVAAIELLRCAHHYRAIALAAEQPHLRELEVLLGPSFRKFCECCEQHQGQEAVRRAQELREQTARLEPQSGETRQFGRLWATVVGRVVAHVAELLEEGTRRGDEMSRPALVLEGGPLKVDLTTCERPTSIMTQLRNAGHGRASRVDVIANVEGLAIEVELVEPPRPFDVAAETGQLVTFSLVVHAPRDRISVPLTWIASDTSNKRIEFANTLELEQQGTQPDWDALLMHPPYTISPVRTRDRLFGRNAILRSLLLNATSGTSTFLWGQKRVGKTSVLQVLAGDLEASGQVACVYLRMGEIVSLHEGQIAHVIAARLSAQCKSAVEVPSEDSFGAGMSRLIPFVERLVKANNVQFVVIIDEFDDLDSAFYTGERGRQFVKALRSLSEVGLAFFFVGSERMDTIYRRHSLELNKWVNLSLDKIESFADCRALVISPVKGAIEYEEAAVVSIVEYCGGNPFYMHLFCFEVFKRCVEDRRTFVSSADVQAVRLHLLKTLGRTNFAHFWDDNPELSSSEQSMQSAENCLVLGCISSLGGRFEYVDEILEAQDSLGLGPNEYMVRSSVVRTVERLRRRRVLGLDSRDHRVEVALPILRDWLSENVEEVTSAWREYVRRTTRESDAATAPAFTAEVSVSAFPVPEDELLSVSQRLVYCGKQKDVAEVRQWLRQFDDDSRIEIAFLLLKRLAEQGYVSEGARGRTLTMVEDALQHQRLSVGGKTWKIVHGRKDNLCITYVDSETKSGATTARDLSKRLRPGKVADEDGIQSWLKAHVNDDPLLVIVDDFAGTGTTLEKGLARLLSSIPAELLETYLLEHRVSCYCQFSFPDAVDRFRTSFPRIEFFAAHVFGDDVRALDPQANIFDSEADRMFASDMLLQVGRELTPQTPLGWGDLGVLVTFHNTVPNNTLPIFWSNGQVNTRPWVPLFPRA